METPKRKIGKPTHVQVGKHPIVGVRLRPGDVATLEWLCETMGMSRADVVKRALAAYAAQVKLTNKL